MQKNENELIKQINQLRNNINNNINNSFLPLINKRNLSKYDIQKWKNNIISNINTEIDRLHNFVLKNKKEAKKTNENEEKKNINKIKEEEITIESKSELNNIITSKNIQEENKDITRNFQNEAYNYMNVNEEVENENVAYFLKDVARISRLSYNYRKTLFDIMKDNYQKSKKITDNNNFNKEFSFWIKSLEKEKGKKVYDNILSQVNIFGKEEINKRALDQKYLSKLFYDLTIMYFHCDISFPSVEISFKKEEDFNSEKMIDFINRGKNRKVNFIIFPSLISNGNFLENGKSFVFTYYKKTFRFEESIIEESLNSLIEQENKNNIILAKIKKQLIIKVYCKNRQTDKYIMIKTNIENIDIPKNVDYEFIFYIKDKYNIFALKRKEKPFTININQKIQKYEFKLNNEIIRTSKDIIDIK